MQKSDNVKNKEVPLRTHLRDPPGRRRLLDVFFSSPPVVNTVEYSSLTGSRVKKFSYGRNFGVTFIPPFKKLYRKLDGEIQILFIALIRKGKQFIWSIKHRPFVPRYCVLWLKLLQCQRSNSSQKLQFSEHLLMFMFLGNHLTLCLQQNVKQKKRFEESTFLYNERASALQSINNTIHMTQCVM